MTTTEQRMIQELKEQGADWMGIWDAIEATREVENAQHTKETTMNTSTQQDTNSTCTNQLVKITAKPITVGSVEKLQRDANGEWTVVVSRYMLS